MDKEGRISSDREAVAKQDGGIADWICLQMQAMVKGGDNRGSQWLCTTSDKASTNNGRRGLSLHHFLSLYFLVTFTRSTYDAWISAGSHLQSMKAYSQLLDLTDQNLGRDTRSLLSYLNPLFVCSLVMLSKIRKEAHLTLYKPRFQQCAAYLLSKTLYRTRKNGCSFARCRLWSCPRHWSPLCWYGC